MIAYIEGKVIDKSDTLTVLSSGGVGYQMHVGSSLHGSVSVGAQVQLQIYMHVRENSQELFAFDDQGQKLLFMRLISVNGVGPKVGMALIDLGPPGEIVAAVSSGDTTYISRASGVGKRVAERVVLDLKDKLGDLSSGPLAQSAPLAKGSKSGEALQALEALGYSTKDAQQMLDGVDPDLDAQQQIKQALKS